MHAAERTEIFEISPECFFDAVTDYKSYPDFVGSVKHVRILKRSDGHVRAKFELHYIKTFEYTLDLYHEPYKRVWWEMVKSNLFDHIEGQWKLKRRGKHKTEVSYSTRVIPRFAAPQFIVNRLVRSNLPNMMNTFYERAAELSETGCGDA